MILQMIVMVKNLTINADNYAPIYESHEWS